MGSASSGRGVTPHDVEEEILHAARLIAQGLAKPSGPDTWPSRRRVDYECVFWLGFLYTRSDHFLRIVDHCFVRVLSLRNQLHRSL